jgi:hypothetical protein
MDVTAGVQTYAYLASFPRGTRTALKHAVHGGRSTVRPTSTVPSALAFLPAYIPVHAKTGVAAATAAKAPRIAHALLAIRLAPFPSIRT